MLLGTEFDESCREIIREALECGESENKRRLTAGSDSLKKHKEKENDLNNLEGRN